MKRHLLPILWLIICVSLFSTESTFKIRKILFQGNETVVNKELSGVIESKAGGVYSQKTAIEDSEFIARLYHNKGIYFVKVSYPEAVPVSANEVDLYFKIDEGKQFLSTKVYFAGNSYFTEERLKAYLGISESTIIPISQLNPVMEQIVSLYADRGYLFAQVEIGEMSMAEDGMEVELLIDEGRYCRFENFVFEGNETTTDKTLLKISGINLLSNFGLSQLKQAEENVRRKEYIRDFSIIPINHTTLLLQTVEEKMTNISGLIGYDSSVKTKGSKLTGFFNLKFLNLYGTDRDLTFTWKKPHSTRESVEFKYHESGPYSIPVAADLLIYRETVDSTYVATTLDTEIYYYNLRNKYGLYGGVDEYFPGTRRPKLIEKSSHKKVGVFWEYNSLDYHNNPTQGMELKIKHFLIINKGQGKWEQRQATELNWGHYTPLTQRSVLIFAINGKQTENKQLKEYELYTLGGAYTLRGFREDQFNGFRVGWANFELRYLLARNSRVFLFTDYGAVQRHVSGKVKTVNDLLGFGLGLRVETRIGLLGIDYGLGHSGGKITHPLDGMVHFRLETKL